MGTRPSPISLGLTEPSSDPSQAQTGFISVTPHRNLRASMLAAVTAALVSSSDPYGSCFPLPSERLNQVRKEDEKQESTEGPHPLSQSQLGTEAAIHTSWDSVYPKVVLDKKETQKLRLITRSSS